MILHRYYEQLHRHYFGQINKPGMATHSFRSFGQLISTISLDNYVEYVIE